MLAQAPRVRSRRGGLSGRQRVGDGEGRGVDPVQLYITVAGVSYVYMSNIHTFSVVFDLPLASEPMMAARRAHAIEVVLGYLRPDQATESLAAK